MMILKQTEQRRKKKGELKGKWQKNKMFHQNEKTSIPQVAEEIHTIDLSCLEATTN